MGMKLLRKKSKGIEVQEPIDPVNCAACRRAWIKATREMLDAMEATLDRPELVETGHTESHETSEGAI